MLNSALLTTVLCVAVLNWIFVAAGNRAGQYLTKPLVPVLLGLGVLGYSFFGVVDLFLGTLLMAMFLSLLGDVFLMLPRDLFVAGLIAFLGAHIAYILVFGSAASLDPPALVGGAAVLLVSVAVGRRLLRGVRARDTSLQLPVLAYMVVITLMVLTVVASGSWWATVGAVLFFASDALIGWSRFIRSYAWAPVAIMVTYHLGQIGLVNGALELWVNSP